MNIKQGEVWLADLGIAAKTRPVVIVSRYDANPPNSLDCKQMKDYGQFIEVWIAPMQSTPYLLIILGNRIA